MPFQVQINSGEHGFYEHPATNYESLNGVFQFSYDTYDHAIKALRDFIEKAQSAYGCFLEKAATLEHFDENLPYMCRDLPYRREFVGGRNNCIIEAFWNGKAFIVKQI